MEIMQKACDEIEENLKKLKQKHPNLIEDDNLRDSLDTLLKDKIGLPYSQKELEDIYNLGKKRFEQDIPPGYMDKDKQGIRKYGDLILWFQVIDKAKETDKSIILVTDDRKEDWWTRHRGKTIGPKAELIDEMISKANVSFYLYQTDPFMENAKKFLNKQVKKKAIDEVREIRERDEERERFIKEATMVSTKFSDALKPLSINLSSLALSDALTRALQQTKSWYPTLKKDIEKAEDSNLSTDFEPKEIDEKDNQQEK